MTTAAIDWGQLFELVWAGALAGVVVSVAFATLILGATRAARPSPSRPRASRRRPTSSWAPWPRFAFAGSVVFGV